MSEESEGSMTMLSYQMDNINKETEIIFRREGGKGKDHQTDFLKLESLTFLLQHTGYKRTHLCSKKQY